MELGELGNVDVYRGLPGKRRNIQGLRRSRLRRNVRNEAPRTTSFRSDIYRIRKRYHASSETPCEGRAILLSKLV